MTSAETAFYVTGGTLRHDAPSYVERQADRELLDGLLKGEFCYVLTSRQMGKSSLMVRTAGKLREQGVKVAVLDLTAIGQNLTPEQWYDGLLVRLGRQLDVEDELEEFWEAHRQMGPCQRLFASVRDVVLPRVSVISNQCSVSSAAAASKTDLLNTASLNTGRLVLFVDELDVVRSLPFSTDEFFAAIRECYNRRTEDTAFNRLTFCLLGVASPSDLIRDTRLTPFNIGRRIELNDFTPAEAAPLAKGLATPSTRNPQLSTALLERVLYWTDGHPYLTQRLCQSLAGGAESRSPESVDRMCETLFFAARAREQDDNLLFVRERMLRSEVDLASLLYLYAQVRTHRQVRDDETNPLVSILRLSGITRARQSQLQVRNRIYARVFDHAWVRANMPDAEMRRQREAYRRGLMRAASVALLVLAVFGALTVYAMRQKRLTEAHLYVADMAVAQQAWEEGSFASAKELIETHRHHRADLRGFEWRYLWRLCRGDEEYILGEHARLINGITFSPDGLVVATRSADSILKVWDLATRQCRFTLSGTRWGAIFLSDGKSMLVGGRTQVRLVDVATGEVTPVLEDAGQLVSLLADGQTVVTTDTNHLVRLWDLPTRHERLRIPGVGGPNPKSARMLKVCVTQNGKRAAVVETGQGYHDEGITVWDVDSQRPVIKLPDQRRFTVMRFSPDDRRLVVGDWAGTLKVWNLDSTNEPPMVRAHSAFLADVAFSSDGRVMATCASDQTIKLWNLTDEAAPRLFATLQGHEGPIHILCFSPDGTRLASGGRDQTVRIWKLDRIQPIDLAPGVFADGSTDRPLYLLSDNQTLVGNSATGVKIWDADRMELRAILPGGELAWGVTTDGRGIHTSGTNSAGEEVIRRRDLQTQKVVKEWPRTGMLPLAQKIVSSPNGQIIVLGNNQGAIQFWDALGWRELALRTNHTQTIESLIFSRDSSTLFSSSEDGTVRVWDMKTLQTAAVLAGTTQWLRGQALSPDGQTLAVGSGDTRIYLWDWRRRKLLATLKGHRQSVFSADFSPDGRTLASGSSDGTVKLWNVALRREIATLKLDVNGQPREGISYVGFSPDGNMLAARTLQGTLKVWRAASWEEIRATANAKKQ